MNNNNSNNSYNNSCNNSDCDNSILFFKLFNNNVIKNNIFRHIKMYNKHIFNMVINSLDCGILEYPYVEYLNSVKISIGEDLTEYFNIISYIIKKTNGTCKFDILFGKSQFQEEKEDTQDDEDDDDDDGSEKENENGSNKNKENNGGVAINSSIEKPILKVPLNLLDLVISLYGSYYQVVEDESLLKLEINLVGFRVDFEYQLKENSVPESVEQIIHYKNWNQSLNHLPSNLKVFHLPEEFNQVLGDGKNQIKSNQLKKLVIECPINEIKSGALPSTIETLEVYSTLNCKVSSDWLPHGLKSLYLQNFQIPLDENSLLPLINLTQLRFDIEINGDLLFAQDKCIFPVSLKKLVFDCPIKSSLTSNSFPVNLEILKFKHKHYYLEDSSEMNNDIQMIGPNVLPSSLKSLRLQYNHRVASSESVPSSVVKVKNINSIEQIKLLPSNVKEVTLSYTFNSELNRDDIPQSITRLIFGKEFYHHFKEGVLSGNSKLKSIRFKGPAPLFKEGSLPETLEHLEFHYSHGNIPILPGSFPSNLKSFILPNQMYSKNLMCAPQSIPNLKATKLMCTYPPFKPSKFPDCLEILSIYSSDPIKLSELPKSLKYLFITGTCKLITPVPSSLVSIYSFSSSFMLDNPHTDIMNILTVFPTYKQFNNHFNNLINKL